MPSSKWYAPAPPQGKNRADTLAKLPDFGFAGRVG